ncbi:hypothetical protein Poli38472_008470 [Pythium oligandrum]|uniref:PDZ domain-containing protein n=1 Tax=Pythium oligandrum TaxID=41045 RepID=A0A8K1C3K7_PYTOL|nr:hypothetical protein Poli38472_008470 [Pythium oligandrum]|eukprot:TMW55822.1 hypothetical protein Poli38472_008470 [Pythium oligandrum]
MEAPTNGANFATPYDPQALAGPVMNAVPTPARQDMYGVHPAAPQAMTPAPFAMKPGPMAERATQLLAVCETCVLVMRINGYDMSYRRIMERKCTQCGGMLSLPQEVMEMLILYGHFIAEPVAASIAIGATVTHPTLRADFVATAMNELLVPLQTDYVYDVALPKRQEGLGMSLRMHKGDLVVGGFIDFEDGSESPSVAARIISVGDALVAINKKSITNSSFEKNIRMLSHAASPVYLTFRRSRPVTVL